MKNPKKDPKVSESGSYVIPIRAAPGFRIYDLFPGCSRSSPAQTSCFWRLSFFRFRGLGFRFNLG